LALTSPTSGGRLVSIVSLRTQATEFVLEENEVVSDAHNPSVIEEEIVQLYSQQKIFVWGWQEMN
jgi:hypothetical protein